LKCQKHSTLTLIPLDNYKTTKPVSRKVSGFSLFIVFYASFKTIKTNCPIQKDPA